MLTRFLAAAAASTAALAFGFTALAGAQTPEATTTASDPQGRFSVEVPKSWASDINFETSPSGRTAILAGADPECQFHAIQDLGSATVSPDAFRRAWVNPIGAAKWGETLTPFRSAFFAGAAPTITEDRVDETSGYFPNQIALATAGTKKVWVSMHPRPGLVVYGFCRTWDDADPSALFARIQASFKTPQDASLTESAAAAEAARAAREAAKAAAPPTPAPAAEAPPAEEPKKRRNVTRVLR